MARRRPRQNAFQRYMAMSDYLQPVPRNILQREARLSVQSQINPILKQIQNAFARRTTAGVGEIQNRQTAGVKIAGEVLPQVNQQYGQRIAAQENVNRGLTELVRSTGGAIVGDLQSKLNRPDASAPAQEAANASTQMAGGFGGSAMSGLIGQQGAATSWAAALPAMRKMQGQAEQGQFRKELRGQQQEAEGELRGQIPGLVRSTYESLLDKQMQAAIAREGFGIDRAQLQQQKQAAKASGPASKVGLLDPTVTKMYNDGFGYDEFGNRIPGMKVPVKPGAGVVKKGVKTTGVGSKNWLKRVDTTRKEAFGLAKAWGEKAPEFPGAPVVPGDYTKARAATISRWKRRHPAMGLKWINQQAKATLVEAGFGPDVEVDAYFDPYGRGPSASQRRRPGPQP